MLSPRQAVFLRPASMAMSRPLYGDGVLGPDVDIALRGSRRHSLQWSWPPPRLKGSPSRTLRSMNAPGSPSSALQRTYLRSPLALAVNCHFRPVGKPAPPRPRRPEFFTSSMTSLRGHLGEHLAQGHVAAGGDVLVNVLGVDDAAVAQGNAAAAGDRNWCR